MSPTATLRLRRATGVLALVWALGAIVLSLGALRAPAERLVHPFRVVRLGGLVVATDPTPAAARAGVVDGSRLLELNGAPYARAAPAGPRALEAGEANRYLLETPDGERLAVSLEPVPASALVDPGLLALHALVLLVAAIYLVTGMTVWWLRPGRPESWAMALFCCVMSAQLATAMQMEAVWLAWPRLLVNAPLIGATTFHLFTSYPLEPDWSVRHPRIQVVPYAAAGLLSAMALLEGPLGLPPGSTAYAVMAFMLFLFALSFTIVGLERRRHGEGLLRDHANVMFFGGVVSFGPAALMLIFEMVFQEVTPAFYATLLLFVLFPVAVGYGIVKKQLFDVRLAARSSATYAAASLAITGVFAFLIIYADSIVRRLGVSERWAEVTFLFLAILAFNPVRNYMQNLVDRFFDRDRAGYRVAVREISEAMVSMLSLNEIADRILLALTDTMGVDRAMVLLVDDDEKVLRPTASRGDWDEEALSIQIPSEHPIWKHLWMRREELSRVDFDDEPDPENREACRDVFDTLEVELLVPILYGVDLLGAIAVGRKLSRERLAPDDRVLLRTLANQSSIAIENAKAFDEIAKLNETLEARVEERTRELRDTQTQLMQAEKMKSLGQLVAGVAHELNNPIGFVHANLQLLDEYMHKLADAQGEEDRRRSREAIEKLLGRSRQGTERVKKIVQDLRTFSRMDQAELQEVDLHEEIDRNLALMEPRFKNDIRVERDYGEIPRVHCFAGQLNQVILNLLMNACDAIERDGTITIRTRPSENGVRLEVQDDGPGIPEHVKSRIFDPFFTTKPVGQGTGLGLSLSHGIVERHGGRIHVDSHPGRGTTFAIELPLEAPQGE